MMLNSRQVTPGCFDRWCEFVCACVYLGRPTESLPKSMRKGSKNVPMLCNMDLTLVWINDYKETSPKGQVYPNYKEKRKQREKEKKASLVSSLIYVNDCGFPLPLK